MKKRIFSLFMVFSLCFVNVNQAYADAGSLIIAGGSVATIGAGAVAGPAVVAVFCAMMAFGMNVELTQASEEAGMTKTEFLKNKIQEYCNEAQISATTFNNYILDQANVFQNGAISISDNAGQVIKKFCNWLFENNEVQSLTDVDSVNINGLNIPVITGGAEGQLCTWSNRYNDVSTGLYFYVEGEEPLALVACDGPTSVEFVAFSNRAFSNINYVSKYYMNGSQYAELGFQSYEALLNNVYYSNYFHMQKNEVRSYNINLPVYNGTVEEFINSINSLDVGGNATISNDTFTGNKEFFDTSSNIINPTDNQTIVINPNITIPVPQDKDVVIDVNEYLDVVQDMIDGLRDDVITAIDDATDVPITIEFDPTQDWDPTIEKEDDTDLPPDDEKTPVIKDDILPHDFDPDPMKFDLKGIFPFCIPWDVKDMLSKLSANPVAPSYTVNWMIPIVNERLIFTVDLSPFDGVAQVCRTMELLAFCIGLAIVTRQLFLRG